MVKCHKNFFDFSSTHTIWTPVKWNFSAVFNIIFRTFFRVQSWEFHRHQKFWIFQAHFMIHMKSLSGCPPTQTPTQIRESGISMFSSQEIGSSLISLKMIFEALQSELFRFKFHLIWSKILKFLGFNLLIQILITSVQSGVKWSKIRNTVYR